MYAVILFKSQSGTPVKDAYGEARWAKGPFPGEYAAEKWLLDNGYRYIDNDARHCTFGPYLEKREGDKHAWARMVEVNKP